MTTAVESGKSGDAAADGAAGTAAQVAAVIPAQGKVDGKAETLLVPAIKEGDKKTEGAADALLKKADAVPEKYALKDAAGNDVTGESYEEVSATAKALGLSNDAAQKLVARDAAVAEARIAKHEAEVVKWMDDIRTDKEMGGQNYAATVESATRLVQKYGSEKLKAELNRTGLGNHPELVRFCALIGKNMDEGKILSGAPVGAKAKPVTLADALYPDKAK